jgi:Xaa-Pro dipeptidase
VSAEPSLLPFAAAEYERRLAGLRALMEEERLDALVLCAPENMYYLTGYETTGFHSFFQALVVDQRGAAVLVTRHFEVANAETNAHKVAAIGYRDDEDPGPALTRVLGELGVQGKRLGIEKQVPWLTVPMYERVLEHAGPGRLRDVSGYVERLRCTKSAAEIGYVRQAAQAADAGMRAGIAAVKEGANERDVAAALFPARILAGSHFVRTPTYIVAGSRSALAHQTWLGTTIKRGDVVYFEAGANVRRYAAGLMRTVVVGKPPDVVRRAADAVITGLTRAIETMAPGVPAEDVDRANRGALEKAGFGENFRHRTGYSIGIEFLVWIERGAITLNRGVKEPLRPNMIFHLVPLVLIPGVGGIGFSETVLVTESGREVLTQCDRVLVER